MNVRLRLAPPPSDTIRVVLAEDHAAVRRTLRRLLDAEAGLDVVAEASDLTAVERQVRGHAPAVLILDLELPDGSGLLAIAHLRDAAPETEVVALTMEESPALMQAVMNAGANGFVLKHRAEGELTAAVWAAAAGRRYISPRLATA